MAKHLRVSLICTSVTLPGCGSTVRRGRLVDVDHVEAGDAEIAKAIGEELRRARDIAGWTRTELISRLPEEIHSQTLAGYERGTIQCTIRRFVEICRAMGVSAPDLLQWSMQRAEVDLRTTGLQIDLHAVLHDKQKRLLPLRRWARKRLVEDPRGSGVAHLEWAVVHEMATMFGISRSQFVKDLIAFTPRPVPRRR
ncbi:helix-turn-helix domain-containing protein [Actinophytocola sp.]|uniref:helix-turn-helix domain-containing protein n=1 Tax=Actinophytocola sp. TaxID=1872138 RepID=UPI0039C8ABE7